MKFSVFKVVKDEPNYVGSCLYPLLMRIDDILVLDTGCSDGSVEMLCDRYGISPLHGTLDAGCCYTICELGGRLSAHVRDPWMLRLDADECLDENDIGFLQSRSDDPSVAG